MLQSAPEETAFLCYMADYMKCAVIIIPCHIQKILSSKWQINDNFTILLYQLCK